MPVGNVPSTASALTGSWSPSPAINREVILADEVGNVVWDRPRRRLLVGHHAERHVPEALERTVDRGEVARDDGVAALGVCLADERLDPIDGFVGWQDPGELEEARLHDGVDPAAHPRLVGDSQRVDHPEIDLLVDEQTLDAAGQVIPDLVRRRTGR